MEDETTFVTRPPRKQTTFELKYLEKYGIMGEKRSGIPGFSPHVQDKEREMEEAELKLKETRDKFENWKTQFQQQKKELEYKNIKLFEKKKMLEKFSISQNNELINIRQKEKAYKAAIDKYTAELQDIAHQEEVLINQNQALLEEIQELQPYANYLQNVVDTSKGFDNPESVLYRYKTLERGKQEHLQRYTELMKNKGEEEKELLGQLDKQRNKLIDTTMQLNIQKNRMSQIKKENVFKKTKMFKCIQRLEDKNLEASQIKSSIKNIYNRALDKSIRPADKEHKGRDVDEEKMLDYIHDRYQDLYKIIEEYSNDVYI